MGADAHLDVIPVLGPALGGRVPRVPQQCPPDSPLSVLLQQLSDLLGLGQELLLELQPHLLRLLVQPAGLLLDTCLLERTGRRWRSLHSCPPIPGSPAWPRPRAQGQGASPAQGPRKAGEGMEKGWDVGASGFAEPNAQCIYWAPTVCPVPSVAPHMYKNFLTLLAVRPEH